MTELRDKLIAIQDSLAVVTNLLTVIETVGLKGALDGLDQSEAKGICSVATLAKETASGIDEDINFARGQISD